jgi:hypothetical protein
MKNNYDEIELPIVFYLVNYLEGKKDILSKCGFRYTYELLKSSKNNENYWSEINIHLFSDADFVDILDFFVVFKNKQTTDKETALSYLKEFLQKHECYI